MTVERAMDIAAASLEMEGLHVDERCREWCKKVINGEITMEEYIELVEAETEGRS